MIQTVYVSIDKKEIPFHILEEEQDFNYMVPKAKPNDWLFHIKNQPSCTVLVSAPDQLTQQDISSVIYNGIRMASKQSSYLLNKEVRFHKVSQIRNND